MQHVDACQDGELLEVEYGIWESNANVLTDNHPPYDPQMGTYQLRGLLCRFGKVQETPD